MAPSFTAQSLSKKCERGRREDRTEKSRAVNTGAKIHRFVGAAIHLCWQKHCRIIASFSSRKSRSSYPYKLEKPVSGPRPCCKVRRQQSCCPPPWLCLPLYSCPSKARLFRERGQFCFSCRRWPSSFLTLI